MTTDWQRPRPKILAEGEALPEAPVTKSATRPAKQPVLLSCPDCGKQAVVVDSKVVYGQSYGSLYICPDWPKCDNYVGCVRNTTRPKGTLANKALREARRLAHAAFDRLWKAPETVGLGGLTNSQKNRRSQCYAWLANELGLDYKDCHIAKFDLPTCRRVVELCYPVEVDPDANLDWL